MRREGKASTIKIDAKDRKENIRREKKKKEERRTGKKQKKKGGERREGKA